MSEQTGSGGGGFGRPGEGGYPGSAATPGNPDSTKYMGAAGAPGTAYISAPGFGPSFSVNNRLVLESYKGGRELKTNNSSGFAKVSQKIELTGLRVLIDAKLSIGNTIVQIPRNSVAYIKQEYLHNHPWAKNILESDSIGEPFVIAELNMIEFIKPA